MCLCVFVFVCVCVCVCVCWWEIAQQSDSLTVQTWVPKVVDKPFGCMYVIITYVLDMSSQYLSKVNTYTFFELDTHSNNE